MKLYHLAVGEQPLVREFIPRIPESAKLPEDTMTPRICLSETLEGCISAVGHPFYNHDSTELLTVWEGDFDERYLISPEFLYDNGYVADCLYTREWWYMVPITLEGRYINLSYFEYTPYRIPDESKKNDIIQYIKTHAKTITEADIQLMRKSNVHNILYKILQDWDRYEIDEEDVADSVGLDNCRMYCNCRFE